MKHFKGALRATLGLLVVAMFAAPAQARITIDALGGELEVEGFLKSETRARIGAGPAYLGQWIQRLQVEAALKYTDVGIFDELTFVAIARPEYDIIQDTGNFSSGRIGEGSDRPSLQSRGEFTFANDALAFQGFDFVLGNGFTSTGGIAHEVQYGFQSSEWLRENFEVDFRDSKGGQVSANGGAGLLNASAFPLVVQKSSNLNLDCARCVDLNVDNLDVATLRTDSNGRLYPFRELYTDAVIGDWWIRLGKQQIVWGKTDFFRLQDVINPVDFGQHFFFDSFEDIRIPQWMASIQWKAGSWGPLTDNAIQVVWNFDEFQQVGLGNPSHFWAHPFAKDTSTFAIFNTFFSPEPCVNAARTAPGAQRAGVDPAGGLPLTDICGSLGVNDTRKSSGFGTPNGLNRNNRPDWDIENTEAGWRWEFRLSDFRFAVSHWYGWNDIPVFKFHTVNMPTRHVPGLLPNNVLIGDLAELRGSMAGLGPAFGANAVTGAGDPTTVAANAIAAGNPTPYAGRVTGVNDPVLSTTPQNAAFLLQNSPVYGAAARNAIATGNYANLWVGLDPSLTAIGCGTPTGGVFCSPLAGGQTSQEFRQSHTLGLAMDYFESWSGVVMRIESSWTFDELVNNTRTADWVDKSDVMRFSLGFDRPTFIPFLNKDRTFFLSLQIFDTWYWDHEGDKNTGYFVDEHNWITTFFFIGNYLRDTLKPVGFYVWEEYSNSHVAGFNLEWLIDNHWSVKGGFHIIWEGDENTTHDVGPFTNFIGLGPNEGGTVSQYPFTTSTLGPARQGIGGLRDYDEIFFELKYQF